MLIARYISTLTSQLRFGGSDTSTLNDWMTTLIPYPRIHFMTPSLAPFTPVEKVYEDNTTAKDLLIQAFSPSNFLDKAFPENDCPDRCIGTQIIF